jgi:ankyrin repeat protein
VNRQFKDGNNPLHMAAIGGNKRIVKLVYSLRARLDLGPWKLTTMDHLAILAAGDPVGGNESLVCIGKQTW